MKMSPSSGARAAQTETGIILWVAVLQTAESVSEILGLFSVSSQSNTACLVPPLLLHAVPNTRHNTTVTARARPLHTGDTDRRHYTLRINTQYTLSDTSTINGRGTTRLEREHEYSQDQLACPMPR
ncbi:hypothetical protein BaRGS_00004850 [Batillaria attramentaria]|uniref:Uncharacterized protein n=1 Tax=Batillaria attramentaria TaxID=370345 RepID=A0ABD0LXN5_9CAEN